MDIKTELTWLQKHERIVIVALVLVAGVFLGNKLLNYESARADNKVAILTATVEQDYKNQAALALQASTAQAAYQTTLDAITKQNASLSAAVQADNALLAKNQAADKVLPLPDLAKRIETLAPGAKDGITATTNGLLMTDTASRSVALELETVPALKDQVDKESQIAFNANMALGKASDAINACTAEVGGLQKTLTDQQAHEVAAVAAEKLKTKKAWRNGFKWGAIAGFIGGVFTYHAVAP